MQEKLPLVVLSGGLTPDGQLTQESWGRAARATRELQKGYSDEAVFTGGMSRHNPNYRIFDSIFDVDNSEAGLMRGYVIDTLAKDDDQKVNDLYTKLRIEPSAGDTFENAVKTAPIIEEKGWDRIGLISEGLHLQRAKLVFSKYLGAKIEIVPLESYVLVQPPKKIAIQAAAFLVTKATLATVSAGDKDKFEKNMSGYHSASEKLHKLPRTVLGTRRVA